jgi:hypothetical protein
MLTVASAYFYKVNRQPGKDLRKLESLPASVICVQDTVHAQELIEKTTENKFSVFSNSNSMTLIANDVVIKSQEEARFRYGVPILKSVIEFEGKEYVILNVNLHTDNYAQNNRDQIALAKDIYLAFKEVIVPLKKNHERIVVLGNFELLDKVPANWTQKRRPEKFLTKLGFNFFKKQSDLIAWYGLENTGTEEIDSRGLGSDHDWLVANL